MITLLVLAVLFGLPSVAHAHSGTLLQAASNFLPLLTAFFSASIFTFRHRIQRFISFVLSKAIRKQNR